MSGISHTKALLTRVLYNVEMREQLAAFDGEKAVLAAEIQQLKAERALMQTQLDDCASQFRQQEASLALKDDLLGAAQQQVLM